MRPFITGEQAVTASLIRGVVLYMKDGVLKYKSQRPVPQEGMAWIKHYKEQIIKALAPDNLMRLEREIKKGLTDNYTIKAREKFKELAEIEDVIHRGLQAWSDVLALDHEIPWPKNEGEDHPFPVETKGKGPESTTSLKVKERERYTEQLPGEDIRRWAR